MNNDELVFIDDAENYPDPVDGKKSTDKSMDQFSWKILIVDDEKDVHDVTALVLKKFTFDGRGLELLHAYSAQQAEKLLTEENDIAVCLLDVVMETDSAGLDLVAKIRDQIGNKFIRIVLRTGQPGQAPEEQVIKNYDINDYKDKTELTRLKLHTLIYSCLRSYRDIIAIDQTRKGLEQVIHASNSVFSHRMVGEFARGILQQICSLLRFGKNAFYATEGAFANFDCDGNWEIIEGIGHFESFKGKNLNSFVSAELMEKIKAQDKGFMSLHTDDIFIASSMMDKNNRNLLFLQKQGHSSELESNLLDIFSNNVLTAFQNIYLMDDIEKAQQEMVFLLAEAIETRSQETGFHLKRVAELSLILATALGLDEDLTIKIQRSSPLHDLGKIAIQDGILNKPGKLTVEEFAVMQTHAQIGHDMILGSQRELCQTGRLIALEHHEHWDGKGYPMGKKAQQISIEGRITAVADVFDALSAKRCYKNAWNLDDVFTYMKDKSGSQFDPDIIDVLLKNESPIRTLYAKYPN